MFGIDDLIIAGSILGGVKKFADNKSAQKNYDREQNLNAVKSATIPWLHVQPTDPQEPGNSLMDAAGGAFEGGVSGAALRQNIDKAMSETAKTSSETATNDLKNKLIQSKVDSGAGLDEIAPMFQQEQLVNPYAINWNYFNKPGK